ncbi:uncharacterized protein LOC129808517 [Phlebotomus papatasi]|uniref:uncharacterized protein LOC129808517 n=1 Tax=Phlebotomus papatasi TaxID=29031 RepID=UPI0024835E26|nr:uncharacterized protein LOC129808517 [Phlebotomus papatasi]
MENRFNREPHLRDNYNKFLQEYLDLGHMTQVQPFRGPDSKVFYLPHYAVLKEDSTTTKLRVVFDASAQSESGSSLNDFLESGPKIQDDLMEILMRWRKFRYVYTADVEKMFRQVLVAEKYQDFQRIFWRSDPTKPVKEYRLNTVTYGTAPATFLAVRALKQLAADYNDEFPLAAQVLQTYFYVDDMLTGCDTKEEAIVLQQQILQLLQRGGFNLRKWTSNSQALLENIPENQRETGICEISPETKIKALGLLWNPEKDEFSYNFSTFEQNKLSKRQLLSNVASIYDPLGFLAPVTVTAKILIQEAWKHEKDWDEELPEDIRKAWNAFNDELHYINNIQVPRWIHHRNSEVTEIHGFCDSSMKAYGAAVYARTVSPIGVITTTLIVAKTRVTPKKMNTVTLPRLELCSALLLAQLLQTTCRILDLTNPPTYAWSDSKITIAWIQKRPEKWNDFVAWRIRRIQELTSPCIWHHVSTNDINRRMRPPEESFRNDSKLILYGGTVQSGFLNQKRAGQCIRRTKKQMKKRL